MSGCHRKVIGEKGQLRIKPFASASFTARDDDFKRVEKRKAGAVRSEAHVTKRVKEARTGTIARNRRIEQEGAYPQSADCKTGEFPSANPVP